MLKPPSPMTSPLACRRLSLSRPGPSLTALSLSRPGPSLTALSLSRALAPLSLRTLLSLAPWPLSHRALSSLALVSLSPRSLSLSLLQVTGRALKLNGHVVDVASNGAAALGRLCQVRILSLAPAPVPTHP